MPKARKLRFVANGRGRILADKNVQAEIQRVREAVQARYAKALSCAGFIRRGYIRMKMLAEMRREALRIMDKVAPRGALHCGTGRATNTIR